MKKKEFTELPITFPAYYENDTPVWLCSLCMSPESSAIQNWDGSVVCKACAEHITNVFYYRHSGRFLTWKNSEGTSDARRKISNKLRKRIFERDAYRCRYCNSYHDLCLDHVVPYSRGGKDREDNLVTACRSCNSKKKDKTPGEAQMELVEIAV